MGKFTKHIVKRNNLILGCCTLLYLNFTDVLSQPALQSSLFTYNKMVFNPGYAGSEDVIPLSFQMRQQWVGFDDSPTYQYVSSNAYLPYQLGTGVMLFNETTGPTRITGANLALSRHFSYTTNGDHWFSFGMSMLLFQNFYNEKKLETGVPEDPVLNGEIHQSLTADASTGIYFYSRNYFAGISATNLFESTTDLFDVNRDFNNPQSRSFFLMGGYTFDINPIFSIEPITLLKYIPTAPFQAEIGTYFTYKNTFWIGLNGRTNKDFIASIGVLQNIFEIAYSYDMNLNDLKQYSDGSHEVMLRFNIANPQQRDKFSMRGGRDRMYIKRR